MPENGQLVVGRRYRAMVRCPNTGLCEARCKGRSSNHVVYIETSTPIEAGRDVVMVFDVASKSAFHTPPDANGTHYWFDRFMCEPRSTELGGDAPPCG